MSQLWVTASSAQHRPHWGVQVRSTRDDLFNTIETTQLLYPDPYGHRNSYQQLTCPEKPYMDLCWDTRDDVLRTSVPWPCGQPDEHVLESPSKDIDLSSVPFG